MTERAQGVLAYLTLLLTCVAGMAHMQWWAACAGAAALALISLLGRRFATAHAPSLYRGVADPVLALSSLLNASAAASAAFVFGFVNAWLWGL